MSTPGENATSENTASHFDSVVWRSAAKVNLTLDVLSRRADGYHELQSIVHTIGLWDSLRFDFKTDSSTRIGADCELICNRPELQSGDNLCAKAVAVWLKAARERGLPQRGLKGWRGVRISLTKNIPSGAGLGGGSGNAAVTLLTLNRRYPNLIDEAQLHDLAAGLGADVPFFLRGGCALMEGIGERLLALQPISGWLLIVQPHQRLDTPRVYAAWDASAQVSARATPRFQATLSQLSTRQLTPQKLDSPATLAKLLHNDLAAAAQSCGVAIDELVAQLKTVGALAASMTGSGSAVFGIFADEVQARHALQKLREVKPSQPIDLRHSFSAVAPFVPLGAEMISELLDAKTAP